MPIPLEAALARCAVLRVLDRGQLVAEVPLPGRETGGMPAARLLTSV